MRLLDAFRVEDEIFKLPGLYTLWTVIFIANMVSLFVDNTSGPVRDFNIITNGLSVIYPAISSANNIYGNGLPSTMMLIAGPIHQYLYWMLFAYYGGSDVLTRSELGIMNWVSLFVVGGFSIDMVWKTWYVAFERKSYINYSIQED